MSPKSAKIAAAGAAAAALASAIAVPALTGAQAPADTTITVQEKVQTVAMDDVAPKSRKGGVSVGDRLVTRQSLFDATDKRIGTLYTDCTGVGPTKPFTGATLLCTVTFSLRDGKVVAAGVAKLDGSANVPIVGGTGAYAGARGSITSGRAAKGYDSADVIAIRG